MILHLVLILIAFKNLRLATLGDKCSSSVNSDSCRSNQTLLFYQFSRCFLLNPIMHYLLSHYYLCSLTYLPALTQLH
jgi:hypothetical protein